jgi:hypothetical protein
LLTCDPEAAHVLYVMHLLVSYKVHFVSSFPRFASHLLGECLLGKARLSRLISGTQTCSVANFCLAHFCVCQLQEVLLFGGRSRVVLLHVNISEKIGSKNVLGIQHYKIQKGIPL